LALSIKNSSAVIGLIVDTFSVMVCRTGLVGFGSNEFDGLFEVVYVVIDDHLFERIVADDGSDKESSDKKGECVKKKKLMNF
jgi:hypothetical protein